MVSLSSVSIMLAVVLLLLQTEVVDGGRYSFRHRYNRLFRRNLFNSRWSSRWPWGSLHFSWKSNAGWWEGPNVCTHTEQKNVSTSIDLMGHFLSTTITCDDKETSYICTKTEVVNGEKTTTKEIKECCHGYKRPRRGQGCTVKQKLEDIVKTAESLNLTEFLRAARSVGLEDKLQNAKETKYTIFAPRNDAFQNAPNLIASYDNVWLNDMNSVIRISPPISTIIVNGASDLVLGHITGGVLPTSRLTDEGLITTSNSKSSAIRVNFYDKIMTANCKRVTSRDNMATNGVIHVVEDILQPVTKSLTDIVSSNSQLSFLKTVLGNTGIGHDLRLDGQYTLFAPTDNAFRKLDPELLKGITGHQSCLKKTVYNHLLPNVICSSAVPRSQKSRTKNMLSSHIRLTRDQDNKVFVEKSQIIDRDIMATNGVLHLIDDVIVPDEAYGIIDALKMRNITKFPELFVQAGLKKSLELAQNITVFVPTDEAFSRMTDHAKKRLNDSETALDDVLQYHVVPETTSCRVPNDYQLPTWNKKRNLTVYSSYMFDFGKIIQCSSIVKFDIPSCNAVIHLIDQVLIPPVGTVIDVLASDKRFSEFVKLLKNSGLANKLNGNGPFTVLAPTKKALDALSENKLKSLQNSKDSLEEFLMRHIHQGHKCCSELRTYNTMSSILGIPISIFDYGVRRQLIMGSSEIIECDMVGTNGVVHAIGKVIQEEDINDDIFSYWG